MSWAAWFTLGVVVSGVGAPIREVLAPDFIFLGMLAVLSVGGVLSPEEALIGFANPGVISVGALFVVDGALQNTRALGFVATRIFSRIESDRRALLRMMIPIAGISAFLNNTPIVAMFTPVVIDWARRHRHHRRRLVELRLADRLPDQPHGLRAGGIPIFRLPQNRYPAQVVDLRCGKNMHSLRLAVA